MDAGRGPYPNVIVASAIASAPGPYPNVTAFVQRGWKVTRDLPRPLFSGVDSLYLHAKPPIRPDVEAFLVAGKAAAVHAKKKRSPLPSVEVAGIQFEIQPRGSTTAPFLLRSVHMDVTVNPAPPSGIPTVVIELSSQFLWQLGAPRAHEAATAVGAELVVRQPLLEAGVGLREPQQLLGVTRCDLCLDFQGWTPPDKPTAYTTRAKKFRPFYEHARFTGVSVGSGDLMARFYEKTEEIRVSRKEWYYPIWRRSEAFDPSQPVWRLEFQLRRVALRSFRLGSRERRISTFADLLPETGAIWRHLTSRWLAIRQRRTASSRQSLAPEWRALHAGGFADGIWNGSQTNLYRLSRATSERRCLGQLAGYTARYLASVSARTGETPSLDDLGQRLLADVRRHGERTGQSPEVKAARLVKQWATTEREACADGVEWESEAQEEPDDDLDP
jgi:hypothetical protein